MTDGTVPDDPARRSTAGREIAAPDRYARTRQIAAVHGVKRQEGGIAQPVLVLGGNEDPLVKRVAAMVLSGRHAARWTRPSEVRLLCRRVRHRA